jgi:7-cyano-7-deazaguanine synthase
MEKAVVLVSGGVGSLVAAAAAREQYELALLHVAWGHRSAERERACFDHLAGWLRSDQSRAVDLSCMQLIAAGARVGKKHAIEDAGTLSPDAPGPPPSFTPGLLPTLLSLSATWAAQIGARRIILGSSENHATSRLAISQLYPDYRRELLQAFNLVLCYFTSREAQLVVEAPLLELTRAEVVRLGDKMGVPFEQTWSCMAASDRACRRCIACQTRITGFVQANVPDPLLVATVSR